MEIKYQGRSYEVKEPDIESWSKLVLLQEWTDEREFSIKLLSMITGLTEEEIENASMDEVIRVTSEISKFMMKDSNKFYNEFEFNSKKYKFLDLTNLTFGEFVDIDSFLSKTTVEKKKEMHVLMAMLYRELDNYGKYKPYDSKLIQYKAEEFKKLPVKYVNGATNFFFRLERISQGNLKVSFWRKVKLMIKMTWLFVKFIVLISIGVGLERLSTWLKKILRRSKK